MKTAYSEKRSRRLAHTRVVIESSLLAKCGKSRWGGFTLSQSSGTIGEMLTDCQRVAPCVLIVREAVFMRLTKGGSRAVETEDSVRVLVLGNRKNPTPELIETLFSLGGMGYLPSAVPNATLQKAVRAIASGQVWANRSIIAQVMRRMISRQLLGELTRQERNILRLIASGLSNRAIADRLCITYETVRWHIRGLYPKLGVQDRFSAIMYGKRFLDSEGVAAPSTIPSIAAPLAQAEPMAPS